MKLKTLDETESKKYEFVENDIKTSNGVVVKRIRALKNSAVIKGDLGGYIKSENNLSQTGYGWVFNGAIIDNDFKLSEKSTFHLGGGLIINDSHINSLTNMPKTVKLLAIHTSPNLIHYDSEVSLRSLNIKNQNFSLKNLPKSLEEFEIHDGIILNLPHIVKNNYQFLNAPPKYLNRLSEIYSFRCFHGSLKEQTIAMYNLQDYLIMEDVFSEAEYNI